MNAHFIRWLCAASLALTLAAATLASAQSIVQSWQGIAGPTGSVPPDPHGTVGPEGVIAVVNLRIAYYSKTGVELWGPTPFSIFFNPVGNSGNGLADPKAVFDHESRRFYVILQENTGSRCWLNVAVSRDADPRGGATALEWIFYRLDVTEYAATNPVGGVNYGGDYPGLAVDSRALYVTYRMYAFNPNGTLNGAGVNYLNTALLILDKSRLLNETGTVVSLYQNIFGLQAVTPQGGTPGNVMYMVDNSASNSITIYSVTDPLGSRTVSSRTLTITDRGNGPSNGAPQSGSPNLIPTINRTLNNATLAAGDIWFCATRGVAAGPAVAAYYRVRLNGWPTSASNPTLAEEGTVGNGAEWNFCPAIGANLVGDVTITWTRSSSSIFPTMMAASRTATAGAFNAPLNVLPNNPAGTTNTANNDGRWGDYFSSWPDPNDGSLWVVSEWTRADTGTWSTWWAQVAMPPRDSYVDLNGNPLLQNGSPIFPWLTVGLAHATITSGTIHIAAGHYNEQLTLNKTVTLQKNGGGGDVVIGAP